MALRGANSPKLVNVIVSQNNRTARNGNGTDAPMLVLTIHLDCNSVSPRSNARACSARDVLTSRHRIETDRLGGILRPNQIDPAPNHVLQPLRIPPVSDP
jgi:hypothetical protein